MWYKGLAWGSLAGIVLLLLSWFKSDWQLAVNIGSWIVVACLVLAIILSGAINNDASYALSMAKEDPKDRDRRGGVVTWLAMFAVPNIAIVLILYRIGLQ